MRNHIKRTITALLALTLLFAVGCGRRMDTPGKTTEPSSKPSASPDMVSASPSAEASEQAGSSYEPSESPMGSPDASPDASQSADAIEGFMEGVVVDPDDVPKLVSLIREHADYRDMAIQSITYKLVDGRQAYYVVLQGEGEASHPIYVFGDDTVVPAE